MGYIPTWPPPPPPRPPMLHPLESQTESGLPAYWLRRWLVATATRLGLWRWLPLPWSHAAMAFLDALEDPESGYKRPRAPWPRPGEPLMLQPGYSFKPIPPSNLEVR